MEFEKVYRTTLCPSCGKEVKVCLNCGFYTPSAHWDCHETIPEPVREKDKVNFCDYFQLTSKDAKKGTSGGGEKQTKAKSQFNRLFDN